MASDREDAVLFSNDTISLLLKKPAKHIKQNKLPCLLILLFSFVVFILIWYISANWFDVRRKFFLPYANGSDEYLNDLCNHGSYISLKAPPKYASNESKLVRCISVLNIEKFDCHPNDTTNEENCKKVGCCYSSIPTNEQNNSSKSYFPKLNTPNCYYPQNYVGYEIVSISSHESCLHIEVKLIRVTPSNFPQDIQQLKLSIVSIDENIVRIKIVDAFNPRHEAPLSAKVKIKNISKDKVLYNVQVFYNGTLFVQRRTTNATIFQVNLSQMVYAHQFLQLSSLLPTSYIWGLGEKYDTLAKNVNWTRISLFAREMWPQPNVHLYGVHPFYVALEADRNSNGVFLLNSNAMDIILQPTPAVTFRTIGGIFDIFVFLGSSPDEVVQQYTQIVGRSFLPPYWSLGFHLCRYNYSSLEETKKVWQRTIDAGIPFDTIWNDIDYMKDHNDFTFDHNTFAGLPRFVEELHSLGMHYVIIIDPGISNTEKFGSYLPYDDGIKMDIFIKNSTGDLFIGKVWNSVSTVFPDFSHPNIVSYWTKQLKDFHDIVPFDGIWIDMNEPANHLNGQLNGCPENSLNYPPYVPGGFESLFTRTLCMDAKHFKTTHYNEHNLYGYREANATYEALKSVWNNELRPFIISRSTFSGQGHWSGHWSGNVASDWEGLRYSVYDMLKYNVFGIPMVGSDICGFMKNTNVELCARWTALGSFYPFSRNHNDKNKIDQDPVALGDTVVAAAKNTLTTRYQLLPYLYSLFVRSHLFGSTVIRPLFFEFVHDAETYFLEEQFLWGPALMIMPALYPGISRISAYFPSGTWYNFYTGEKYDVNGGRISLEAPLDSINLALRGGYILPQQHSNTTVRKSRGNKFFLYAGLDNNGTAEGELYWDDGSSLDSFENSRYSHIVFNIDQNTFLSNVKYLGFKSRMELDFVKICRLEKHPTAVTFNNYNIHFEFDTNNCLKVVLNVSLLKGFTFTWK